MSGRLIVLEGTDGSGKATQTRLLCEALERRGRPWRKLSFPRYGKPSAALVEEYLRGGLGDKPGDVNAYAASLFYAVDRYASFKQDWGEFYASGNLVVADRYTTSNAVHQGSKLPSAERRAYWDWLFQLEYGYMGLPAPDLVVYLDMPVEVSAPLLRARQTASGAQADIHERDQAYLRSCREAAAQAAKAYGWQVIPCARDGAPRPIEEIHAQVLALAEPLMTR